MKSHSPSDAIDVLANVPDAVDTQSTREHIISAMWANVPIGLRVGIGSV